jgi:hypothetical protein
VQLGLESQAQSEWSLGARFHELGLGTASVCSFNPNGAALDLQGGVMPGHGLSAC